MINAQTKHCWLIELLAYWEGQVNATQLSDAFQISRQQAQKYIRGYLDGNPDALVYDASLKGHCPTALFAPLLLTGQAGEYLDWLDHRQTAFAEQMEPPLTNTHLQLPERHISPLLMRGLISAIRQRRRIEVEYASLTHPVNEGRVIQPHVFVKTGLRWHLRAWCEDKKAFRDFVLSRFRGEPALLSHGTHNGLQDKAWQSHITLVLIANPGLNAAQRHVIEQDYQMQYGELRVDVRAALAQYLLNEMQVDIRHQDDNPLRQQLILANKDDVKQWLFAAN